jgi:hypothetical protein
LEVATYRLNTLTPAATSAQCVTTPVTTPAAGHGVCPPVTESEGNVVFDSSRANLGSAGGDSAA